VIRSDTAIWCIDYISSTIRNKSGALRNSTVIVEAD